jgi:hypothetical protein
MRIDDNGIWLAAKPRNVSRLQVAHLYRALSAYQSTH